MKKKFALFKLNRGFSLIELIVTMGIFALITGLVLARQSEFNNGILLTNLGYEVALVLREAQVYGLGIREAVPGQGSFSRGFGVHFDDGDPTSIIFFANTGGSGQDKVYVSDNDAVLEVHTLRQGYRVSEFCAYTSAIAKECATELTSPQIESLDVVFERPDPDAIISTSNDSVVYEKATMSISSPSGETVTVTITRTGQISVSRP